MTVLFESIASEREPPVQAGGHGSRRIAGSFVSAACHAVLMALALILAGGVSSPTVTSPPRLGERVVWVMTAAPLRSRTATPAHPPSPRRQAPTQPVPRAILRPASPAEPKAPSVAPAFATAVAAKTQGAEAGFDRRPQRGASALPRPVVDLFPTGFDRTARLAGQKAQPSGADGPGGFDRTPRGRPIGTTVGGGGDLERSPGFDHPSGVGPPGHERTSVELSGPSGLEIRYKPKPIYPDEARERGVQGEVVLAVRFAASGRVEILGVLRRLDPVLDDAARHAVERILFTPARQDGQPIDVRTTIRVLFLLT